MILGNRPHLQGLVLGTAMLVAAATGTPAAWHALQDLVDVSPPVGKVATSDRIPKEPNSGVLVTDPRPSANTVATS